MSSSRPLSYGAPRPQSQYSVPLRSDDDGNPLPSHTPTQSFAPPARQSRYSTDGYSPSVEDGRYDSQAIRGSRGGSQAVYHDQEGNNPFDQQNQQGQSQYDSHQSRHSQHRDFPSPQYHQHQPIVQAGSWGGEREGYDESDFNVADDFNNAGPTHSEVFGGNKMAAEMSKHEKRHSEMGMGMGGEELGGLGANGGRPGSMRSKSYRPDSYYSSLGNARDPKGSTRSLLDKNRNDPSGVEMITVPALGAEWDKDELHFLSRRGKKELISDRRHRVWTEFRRDQRGLCGIKWLTRQILVYILFGLCVALALILFFTIPRAPNFTIPTSGTWTVNNATVSFSRTPANYSFAGDINLFVDSTSSYLPVHFSALTANVYDYSTAALIGTGILKNKVIPHQNAYPLSIPVEWSYVGVNASDITWLDMYNSCQYLYNGVTRPSISFRVELYLNILGLVTKPGASLVIPNLACPFERASNSV